MYKHILIATDGSELANVGLVHGLALAKEKKAKVTVVTITPMWSAIEMARLTEQQQHKFEAIQHFEDIAASSAKTILDAAAKKAKQADVACELVHISDRHPAEGIVGVAESKGCDLIVMASHGRRGIGRLVLGSVANEVLSHCKVPALIVR